MTYPKTRPVSVTSEEEQRKIPREVGRWGAGVVVSWAVYRAARRWYPRLSLKTVVPEDLKNVAPEDQ